LRWIKPGPGSRWHDRSAIDVESKMSSYETMYLMLVVGAFVVYASAMAYATWLGWRD
jgi:hypothetical protein